MVSYVKFFAVVFVVTCCFCPATLTEDDSRSPLILLMKNVSPRPAQYRRYIIAKKSLRQVFGNKAGKFSHRISNFKNVLVICHQFTEIAAGEMGLQLLARQSFPTIEVKPYNQPSSKEIDIKKSYADEKFQELLDYYGYMSGRMKEPHNPTERREILEGAQKKLFTFIDTHIKDMKRLLFTTDAALMAMVLLKLNKKMDTSEAKIRNTQAKIPFGVYVSPEFKCLGTSYYVASSHNQEDAQMILSSERKPHCYTWRGAFAFIGFYHRHSETTYVGPHGEQFQTTDPSQGLYCHSDDNWSDTQCLFKVNPREEFPESVEYEPKVSYWCGPYRYFIPATTDIRCIFSIFSMNFILRFGYDGVTYKTSDLSFMYANGQVFYTDEPWAGMSCWTWACKWRHNQNMRSNEFFVS